MAHPLIPNVGTFDGSEIVILLTYRWMYFYYGRIRPVSSVVAYLNTADGRLPVLGVR
jgi:hypothetical protein